jgi:hypothetical protein
VLCGPEICCKSLAEFFLIRNILKECGSCSHIFLVLIGKHVHTLFIFARQIFFFQNTRSRSSDAISGKSKCHPTPSLSQLESERSAREVSRNLKKLSTRQLTPLTSVLSLQPDFANEKPLLQLVIEKAGHVCLFLPMFHCELNPIEMVWGQTKRSESRTSLITQFVNLFYRIS